MGQGTLGKGLGLTVLLSRSACCFLPTCRAQHLQAEYLRLHSKAGAPAPGEAGGSASQQRAAAAAGEEAGPSGRGQGGAAGEEEDFSEEALDARLRKLDGQIGEVYQSLPSNTLLMVCTGQGDTAEGRRLQELQYKRQGKVDGLPKWTQADEEAFCKSNERELLALCFCAVKQ